MAMAASFLQKRGLATVERQPSGSRGKLLALGAKGLSAKDAGDRLIASIEERWTKALGTVPMRKLGDLLERLAGDGTAASSPLFRGLAPYPDGWRATLPPMQTLPYYPMVLHRGGFPEEVDEAARRQISRARR
jgi:hypothetical protein